MVQMRFFLSFILVFCFSDRVFSCCAGDGRSLSERLFNNKGDRIFICKVLTFVCQKKEEKEKENYISCCGISIDADATAEVIEIFSGNMEKKIISIKAHSFMEVGKSYLIFNDSAQKKFSYGGPCNFWDYELNSKFRIKESEESDLKILRQFSNLIHHKHSGFFNFYSTKGIKLAEGEFQNGQAVNTWTHYYPNGIIKSEFDLTNSITRNYSEEGCLTKKTYINPKPEVNNIIEDYECYSHKLNQVLIFTKSIKQLEAGKQKQYSEYYPNGKLKSAYSRFEKKVKKVYWESDQKTGEYLENYENGNPKTKGFYSADRKSGNWKYFSENGQLIKEENYPTYSD